MASLIDPGILLPTYSLLSGLFSPLAQTSTAGQTQNSTPTVASSTQTTLSSLGQLLSALDVFQSSLQSLYSPWQSMTPTATTSNSSVASAYAGSSTTHGNYAVTVSNLAQSQTLQSSGFASSSSTIGSGNLVIQSGSISGGSFTSDGSTPTTVTLSNASLSGIANAINSAGGKVNATLTSDASNQYHLVLASNTPGSTNAFTVSSSGDAALSGFAWTPAASTGMTLSQSASNANYSVNSVSASASANTGISLGNGLYLNLAGTGSTQITVATAPTDVHDAAQQLVTAFNNFQTSVNSLAGGNPLTGSTGALQRDSITTHLINSMNQMALGSFSNGASTLSSLMQIGINYQHPQQLGLSGSMTLSSGSLQLSFSQDAGGTVNLIRTAAQSFYNLSDSYSNYGNGSIPLTLNALTRQLSTESVLKRPPQGTLPGSIASLLLSQATSGKGSVLSAQQMNAMMQYASVYALTAPYSLQSAILGSMSTGATSSGNGISIFA